MDKSLRIHTEVGNDHFVSVNMAQDYDFLEVLSLKLKSADTYKLHMSDYGVVVGRVLANDAFGIPNAKVSVFIDRGVFDDTHLSKIYPYTEVMSNDADGRRYNLFPSEGDSDDDCYRPIGTFPSKRMVLDNDSYIEVYEKYWKYTTVTNSVGDYMIFGVPSGSHEIHVDIDLSDIGVLSQKPRDFEYKGYDITQFDNANQFKTSTNLDNLSQVFSQNKGVNVYPFWGNDSESIAAITRCDVQIQYKFEPTCVFMGSIVSDNDTSAFASNCSPAENHGRNNQLIAGEGTIEMIRVTNDGLVEEFPIQGNRLIDSDGVWCYQIPMNLDFVGMDEYGNIVPTDSPSKGIPTRTRVRFRISKNESGEEGFSRHTAKYLVPNNPELDERYIIPRIPNGKRYEEYYTFGSATPKECFRDLYWNNVYTVKNYIPKVQIAANASAKKYSALKGANTSGDKNAIPFNKLFIDIPFTYMVLCILFQILMRIITIINSIIVALMKIKNVEIIFGIKPFSWIIPWIDCISLSAGLSEGDVAYFPGCDCEEGSDACKHTKCPEDFEGGKCRKSSDNQELEDKIQQNLAVEYNIVSLDLQQDWVNGVLYMPLWYWKKAKKRYFFFGLFSKPAVNEFCNCNKTKYTKLKTYMTCDFTYRNNSLSHRYDSKEDKWHKNKKNLVKYRHGLIKPVENEDGLVAYYYTAANPRSYQSKGSWYADLSKYEDGFDAVRLYATDIVLLGSMDVNNIYGIPQLYDYLPSTSSNVPPISTVMDDFKDEDTTTASDLVQGETSGSVVVTGMDWGYNGSSQQPKYGNGLFLDLSCTAAKTYEKSCINVERVSEYGMVLDMSYSMPYGSNGTVEYGDILTDGFVNKLEIENNEFRSMFATMNHVGFYPDDTKKNIPGLESGRTYDTQVLDKQTGYPIPKFKYIYLVDFDGRLEGSMTNLKNGFPQELHDEPDESYLTFRFGAEKRQGGGYGRIRHFYINSGGLAMPLYNNSFYFYFGINKGNTAIEKFKEKFSSQCFKTRKWPFSLEIDKQGQCYKPSAYIRDIVGCDDGAYAVYDEKAFSYIKLTMEDILTDYSYSLYDSSGYLIISENYMTATTITIGQKRDSEGRIIGGGVTYLNEETEEEMVIPEKYRNNLPNGTYKVVVTDVNGNSVTRTIQLNSPNIRVLYEPYGLATKFYNTENTPIDDICNTRYDYYGRLVISGFSIDGVEYGMSEIDFPSSGVTSVSGSGELSATVVAYTIDVAIDANDPIGSKENRFIHTKARVTLRLQDAVEEILPGGGGEPSQDVIYEDEYKTLYMGDCGCDAEINPILYNTMYDLGGEPVGRNTVFRSYPEDDAVTHEHTEYGVFYLYYPTRYQIEVEQLCIEDHAFDASCHMDSSVTYHIDCNSESVKYGDNVTVETFNIDNGEGFRTYLNTMPMLFMLGSLGQTSLSGYGNNLFYGSEMPVMDIDFKVDRSSSASTIYGWFGLFNEKTYSFNSYPTTVLNESIWSDYSNVQDGTITDIVTRRGIVLDKFRMMFALCRGCYETNVFRYTAKGGAKPTLFRSLMPDYVTVPTTWEEYHEKAKDSIVMKFSDISEASGLEDVPHIYDFPYPMVPDKRALSTIVTFNELYCKDRYDERTASNYKAVGNYFAAFTNNGGFNDAGVSIDTTKYVKQIPSFANVVPSKRVGKVNKYKWSVLFTNYITKSIVTDTNSYNPYFRALSVDRRLKYLLLFFSPYYYGTPQQSLSTQSVNSWIGGRVSGNTYNGIEMSYSDDDDKNVISASILASKLLISNKDYEFGDVTDTDDVFVYIMYNAQIYKHVWRRYKSDGYRYSSSDELQSGQPLTIFTDHTYKVGALSHDSPLSAVYTSSTEYFTSTTLTSSITVTIDGVEYQEIYTESTDGFAVPNNLLEYSYKVPQSSYVGDFLNSYTIYNNGADDEISWTDTTKRRPRRFYEATINGVAVTNWFYSDETAKAVSAYTAGGSSASGTHLKGFREVVRRNTQLYPPSSGHSVFCLDPSEENGSTDFSPYSFNKISNYPNLYWKDSLNFSDHYNGTQDVKKPTSTSSGEVRNYPIIRLIDIGGLSSSDTTYDMSITSCGYDMTPYIDDGDMIRSEAVPGDEVKLSVDLSNPISLTDEGIDIGTKINYSAFTDWASTTSFDTYPLVTPSSEESASTPFKISSLKFTMHEKSIPNFKTTYFAPYVLYYKPTEESKYNIQELIKMSVSYSAINVYAESEEYRVPTDFWENPYGLSIKSEPSIIDSYVYWDSLRGLDDTDDDEANVLSKTVFIASDNSSGKSVNGICVMCQKEYDETDVRGEYNTMRGIHTFEFSPIYTFNDVDMYVVTSIGRYRDNFFQPKTYMTGQTDSIGLEQFFTIAIKYEPHFFKEGSSSEMSATCVFNRKSKTADTISIYEASLSNAFDGRDAMEGDTDSIWFDFSVKGGVLFVEGELANNVKLTITCADVGTYTFSVNLYGQRVEEKLGDHKYLNVVSINTYR